MDYIICINEVFFRKKKKKLKEKNKVHVWRKKLCIYLFYKYFEFYIKIHYISYKKLLSLLYFYFEIWFSYFFTI